MRRVDTNMNKKVLLGMSGGVDSSVAAILLKEQGYEVIGVTMKLWEGEIEGSCCSLNSTSDAKRVCDYLKIPHYTLNFKDDFNKYVVQDFIDNYKNCRTPNPCIECNRYLKFGAMFKKAQELGCDYIATGHYAKILYSEKYGKNVLAKSNAGKKDQSYVLYNIPDYMLDHVIFPLGDFKNKDEIREIARKNNLLVANKPDSEDICFIPDGNYKRFLEENSNIKPQKGNIVNSKEEVLGKHTGLYNYTIGQRRGLGISSSKPLYVLKLNKKKNQVIVGEEKELYIKEFLVKDFNILVDIDLSKWTSLYVKTRYSAKEYKANIILEEDKIRVVFDEPQRAITPGQSAVFYDGDVVVGGGKIV